MAAYTLRVGSFCAGVGGLELGIKIALRRAHAVVLCERDSYAASTLVSLMARSALDSAPIWDRVDTFPAEEFRGCLDLLCAGYPCQPFSIAGRQLGTADERHIWPHIARIIDICRPPIVWLENVANHLALGFGPAQDPVEEALRVQPSVRESLQAMGYRIEAGLFRADEVGPPHERKRLFILGVLKEVADAGRGFVQESGRRSAGRNGAGSGGAELPNANAGQCIEPNGEVSAGWGTSEHGRPELRYAESVHGGVYARSWDEGPGAGNVDWECSEFPNGEIIRLPKRAVRARRPPGNQPGPVAEIGKLENAECFSGPRAAGFSGALSRRPPTQTSGSGTELGNAAGVDQPRLWPGARDEQSTAGRSGGELDQLGNSGGSEHAQRGSVDGLPHEEQPPAAGTGFPIFPPGRSDIEAWARIRETHPHLWPAIESSVRMLVDGVPVVVDEQRPEQLRCTGNAVVPIEAAYAFITLAERAGIWDWLNEMFG